MSDFEDLPVGDKRERKLKPEEYYVLSVGTGKIICSRPGVRLIDFYLSATPPDLLRVEAGEDL